LGPTTGWRDYAITVGSGSCDDTDARNPLSDVAKERDDTPQMPLLHRRDFDPDTEGETNAVRQSCGIDQSRTGKTIAEGWSGS
jgi:hypothetical protein